MGQTQLEAMRPAISMMVCRWPTGCARALAAIGDGALGFCKAMREVFPATREQRCWFHMQAKSWWRVPDTEATRL
jgi:transposase-like protein